MADTPNSSSSSNNYQISDAALKSLANSRGARRGMPPRTYSADSNNSGKYSNNSFTLSNGNTAPKNNTTNNNNKDNNKDNNNGGEGGGDTTTAASNNHDFRRISSQSRSSSGSMWSSLMGRGQRIFGSIVSVGSSITMLDFSRDYWDEFERSELSLLGSQHNDTSDGQLQTEAQTKDTEPMKPQRKISVMQSSDLSPRQPGRKTSIQTVNSEQQRELPLGSASATGTPEKAPIKLKTAPFKRVDSKDSVPQYPARKSSKSTVEQSILTEVQIEECHDQATVFVRAVQDILIQQCQVGEGMAFDNVFVGQLAIDRMTELGMVDSRQEALEMGRYFQEKEKLFHHITDMDKLLEDNSQDLYVLTPPSTLPPELPIRRKTNTNVTIEEEEPLEEETAKPIAVPPVKR